MGDSYTEQHWLHLPSLHGWRYDRDMQTSNSWTLMQLAWSMQSATHTCKSDLAGTEHTHRGSSAWFVCLAAEDGDRLTGSGEEIGEWRTGIGSQARWLRCWRCFEGEDGMEACMEKKWWLYRLFSFSEDNRRGRCTMKNFLFFLDNSVWRKPISLFGCIGRLSVLDIHLIFPIRSGVRYSVTC
jgi:hypothetical protein